MIFRIWNEESKEVGAENVFDFSIGNPSVPAPKEIDETALRLLKQQIQWIFMDIQAMLEYWK